MLTPAAIARTAENKFKSVLQAEVTGERMFPMPVRFGKEVDPTDITQLRTSITQLHAGSKETLGYGYVVTYGTHTFQRFGPQQIPTAVFFESSDDLARFINRQKDLHDLRMAVSVARTCVPELEGWLVRHPLAIVNHVGVWSDLLKVCAFFVKNPRSNLYRREIPVSVHTKFIEQHEAILCSMLNHLLRDHVDDAEQDFCRRFHLRDNEPMVRIRFLDLELAQIRGFHYTTDFALPVSQFNRLPFDDLNVIVSENLMPLLTLPSLRDTVAFFGSGNAVNTMKHAPWLKSSRAILYWGDIDDMGYRILSRFRSELPLARSVLMDRETFEQSRDGHVPYSPDGQAIPERLTTHESQMYLESVATRTRLEQERLPLTMAHERIRRALHG